MLVIIYFTSSVMVFLFSIIKKWYGLAIVSYFCFLVVFFAIIPLPGEDKKIAIAPTQVVFRFDEFRSLQLTGSRCQGILYYVDEKEQVYSLLAPHSARILTEPFMHTVGGYIFIPYSDYRSGLYSVDGGRTFNIYDSNSGTSHVYLNREDVEQTRVVNNQLFLLTKNGEIYLTPKPFGAHYSIELLTKKFVDSQYYNQERYRGARWENIDYRLPDIPADYSGWTEWRCDLDAKKNKRIIYDRFAPIKELQNQIKNRLGIKE